MRVTRREFTSGLLGAGAAALIPGRAIAGPTKVAAPTDDFSFVHLTDMHVTKKRWGDKGYRTCIESVRDLSPRPAFAMMGGDLAFDGLYTPRDEFEEQIRLYKEITAGLGMPHHNCMGNHDVLGWSERRRVPTDDPELGKKLIMDRLEWEKSYYSFDHGGWHFAVLDCIHPKEFEHGPGYEPRIGAEQLEWLAYDLGAAGDRPKVVMTHIAAFCNRGQQAGNVARKSMDGSTVLWDTSELRDILERHSVKAVLQGHTHKIEEYRLNNVAYVTSAAVSGAWWAGNWVGSPPGYTVFRCAGGALSWTHHVFGWETHLEEADVGERLRIKQYEQHALEQAELRRIERAGTRP